MYKVSTEDKISIILTIIHIIIIFVTMIVLTILVYIKLRFCWLFVLSVILLLISIFIFLNYMKIIYKMCSSDFSTLRLKKNNLVLSKKNKNDILLEYNKIKHIIIEPFSFHLRGNVVEVYKLDIITDSSRLYGFISDIDKFADKLPSGINIEILKDKCEIEWLNYKRPPSL